MEIGKISPLFASELKAAEVVKPQGTGNFASILDNLITNAEDATAVSQQMTDKLLTGEINDLHSVTIASAKAGAAVDLVVAVRNKVVDAYNEVMRMSV